MGSSAVGLVLSRTLRLTERVVPVSSLIWRREGERGGREGRRGREEGGREGEGESGERGGWREGGRERR